MVKGKRKRPDPEEELNRPWCYYCEKDFTDYQNLTNHQRQKHFACGFCNRRLNTVGGLRVHLEQVHKESLHIVENALPNRSAANGPEIFNMEGIPDEFIQLHRNRILQRLGEEYPNGIGSAKKGPAAKKVHEPKIEVTPEALEEMKARAKALREKNKARREAIARGEMAPGEVDKMDSKKEGQVTESNDGSADKAMGAQSSIMGLTGYNAEANNPNNQPSSLSNAEAAGLLAQLSTFSPASNINPTAPPGTGQNGYGYQYNPGLQTPQPGYSPAGYGNPYPPPNTNITQPFNGYSPQVNQPYNPYNGYGAQQTNPYGKPPPLAPQPLQGLPHPISLPSMPNTSQPPPQVPSPGLPFAPHLPRKPPKTPHTTGPASMTQNFSSTFTLPFMPPSPREAADISRGHTPVKRTFEEIYDMEHLGRLQAEAMRKDREINRVKYITVPDLKDMQIGDSQTMNPVEHPGKSGTISSQDAVRTAKALQLLDHIDGALAAHGKAASPGTSRTAEQAQALQTKIKKDEQHPAGDKASSSKPSRTAAKAQAPQKISKKDREKPQFTKLLYSATKMPEERRASIARYSFSVLGRTVQ